MAKKLIKNLLLLFFVVVLMIFLIEVFLKLFMPQNLNITQLDEEKVFELKPEIKSVLERQEFSTTAEINSIGLRDKEYSLEKDDSTIRVAAVGDSFVFGFGVEENEAFPTLLERKLNSEMDKDYEVMNFGVSAYGTEQELILIENDVLKYSPEIILLGFGSNDLKENVKFNLFDIENGKLVRNEPPPITTSLRLRNFISWNSHLYSLVYFSVIENQKIRNTLVKLNLMNAPYQDPSTDFDSLVYLKTENEDFEYSLEKTLLLLDEIYDVSKKSGTKLVIFIIPYKEQVDDNKLQKFRDMKNLVKEKIDTRKINRIIAGKFEETDVLIIDPLSDFRENNINNTFYFDIDGHWNRLGHALAAEIIFEELSQNGLVS